MEPLRLVIIEDEEAHFQLMKHAIEKVFPLASVDYFDEPEACLKRLDEISPDIIITDYLMPGMTGIELLEILNQQKKDIPVIMITGQGDENIAIQAMKLGAWDYLVKSGDFFTLLPSVIEKVVRERKLKESLQWSERRFEKFFAESPIGIKLYDVKGLLFDANKACLEILGKADVSGLKGLNLFDDPNLSPDLKERLLRGETVRYEAAVDCEKPGLYETAKSGTIFLDVVTTPLGQVTDNRVRGYLVQIQDVTERKLAEQEKKEFRARMMEAISNLAGGIAHDFNNALTGITGNIELLKMDLPKKKSIDRYLESMNNAALRMAHLNNQLLAYSRGGKYWPKELSLSKFLEETLPMILNKIDPAIRVEVNPEGNIYNITADYTQMHMVLSALVTNAAEAIEGQGSITITAGNEEADEGFAMSRPGLKPGSYACLTIQDDGKGMDEEAKHRIFEPFFTRKFHGRGLGMAAVYGIVKNHEGWISVDSQQGKGTAVRVYFPGVDVQETEKKYNDNTMRV